MALGDRFRHQTHHTNHPLAHWLALKKAMHWTVDALATNTTLPNTWLPPARNIAAYVLDVMAQGRGTDFQKLHRHPGNPRQQEAGQAPAQGRARTGIQHLPRPQRPEASPAASAGTGAAQATALTGRRRGTGPAGQTTKACNTSSAALARAQIKTPDLPILHTRRTQSYAPRLP